MHSHNYRRPETFVGQTLVVVGAAFSGSDISQELLDHGARAVYLSGRNWRISPHDPLIRPSTRRGRGMWSGSPT